MVDFKIDVLQNDVSAVLDGEVSNHDDGLAVSGLARFRLTTSCSER